MSLVFEFDTRKISYKNRGKLFKGPNPNPGGKDYYTIKMVIHEFVDGTGGPIDIDGNFFENVVVYYDVEECYYEWYPYNNIL